MLGNSIQSLMSLGLLLLLTIALVISGTDGRRRKASSPSMSPSMSSLASNGQIDPRDCMAIRSHTPDFLHYIMTSDPGLELAAFYNSGSSGQQSSSNPFESDNEIKQSHKSEFLDNIIFGSSKGFQPLQEQDVADKCMKVSPCDRNARYRTINGTCNNLGHPMWGMTGSAIVRLLPAKYQDGEHKIRKSESGKDLPNVRQLRTSLFVDNNVPDGRNMYNVMQWGQLVAHDLTHIMQQDIKSQGLDCCQPQCAAHTDVCAPIEVPLNDQFYSKYHQPCLNFARSATTTNMKCPISPQQQVISVTHFLDASVVYGSTDNVARKLRTHKDGLLVVQTTSDNREFPPQSDTPNTSCDNVGSDQICYATGDSRVNANPGITVLQTILLREHNRLARVLKELNPHWDDERLYQEARKIVGAEVQRITYNAYLPTILGPQYMQAYGLLDGRGDQDFVNDYDEHLNPSTLNEFNTAAFRAFHSMIPREVRLYDDGFNPIKTLYIDDFYFRPSIIQKPRMLDKFLRGLAAQPAQSQDYYFSAAVSDYLFKSNMPYGKDLESLDMQRGRDHGLPTYNDLRRACGLRPASHFDDLIDAMHQDAVKALQSKYETVEDIDLFVGGLLETRAPDTLVGPTFACIIGEQFKRKRNGDRFYYEFGDQAGSFTHDQLKEIRKITLAELFCRNGDDIDRMPLDVFHPQSLLNPIKSCKNIMKMDLSPWKENTFVL